VVLRFSTGRGIAFFSLVKRLADWRLIPERWVLLGWIVLGAWLRTRGLFVHTFHSDEALFGSWARLIAVWRDPLLRTVAVDKPPLLFYAQALFYPMQGAVEWAARLPNWIGSILVIPLVARIARQCGGERPWLAAALVACSPLAIQFSGTAFTDPLMTFWLVLSLSLLIEHRWGTAGFVFGLALATKYQAGLFLPLWLVLLLLDTAEERDREERQRIDDGHVGLGLRGSGRFLVMMLVVMALVFAWEWGRSGSFTLWGQQMGNFGGLRVIWSWELWPRLVEWGKLWGFVLGGGWLGLFWIKRDHTNGRNSIVAVLLSMFVLGYAAFHWLIAIPAWDRYLLPMVPLIAIWVACLVPIRIERGRALLPFALCLCILLAGLARYSWFPVGGAETADQGAAALAIHLEEEPYGTVLYDHWYSWQWRYHLFDEAVYVSWFPHPERLVEELDAFMGDGNRRYVALPVDGRGEAVMTAVQEAGFGLEFVAQEGEIGMFLVTGYE